jgi:meiotically up-regulated gene 157 (Mug157) protein
MPFLKEDPALLVLIQGLLHRMARSVLIDPWANAFDYADEGSPHSSDIVIPPMTAAIYESKFELDSLVSVLKLSARYWQVCVPGLLFLARAFRRFLSLY